MYLDANNLYGLAMSAKLPYNKFKWNTTINENDILNYDENSKLGYILKVDLEYPKELHDKHRDYPLLAESRKIKESELSDFTKQIHKDYTNKDVKDGNCTKLILDFNDKNDYVVHISNLKYYLQNGIKLKRIVKCIEFRQKSFLEPYIALNTNLRKQAKTDFEKDFYKLMNNSVFGKTMEDVRNRINYELTTNEERAKKLLNHPAFKLRHIIKPETENDFGIIGVEKTKAVVRLNKPIYCGFTILELSKNHMQKFLYDTLKPFYGNRVRLAYTDTDSFILEIETDDVYDDFLKPELKEHMDFSDYPETHKCFNTTNKKVLGKFKDEENGKIIKEAICLKPKMYAIKTEDGTHKKAKGIPKKKVEKELPFNKYKSTLNNTNRDKIKYTSIRSEKHVISTINQEKTGLSNYDDKRYWKNNLESLPYGHYSL